MVNRIEVPASVSALQLLDRIDYEDAFAVPGTVELSPEQWARLFFDGTSELFRTAWWWLFSGFRFRAAPPERPNEIYGWKILHNRPEVTVLGVTTPIGMTARLVTTTPPGQTVISTLIQLDSTAARAIWPVVGYLHRVTMRYLLGHAAAAAINPHHVEYDDHDH